MSDHFMFSSGATSGTIPPEPPAGAPENHTGAELQKMGKQDRSQTIRELLPYFLSYSQHQRNIAPKTLRGYTDALLRVLKVVGDVGPEELDLKAVLAIKQDLAEKGVGAHWTRGIVNALRSFLRFCHLILGLAVLDPRSIKLPRIPRRDVVFLTPEEIETFLLAIPVFKSTRQFNVRWLGFRALVEVLLGTGMRISEALSLRRSVVNFDTGEAQIIGKGNKERTIFFTPRALGWLKEYMNHRTDNSECMFVLPDGAPVKYDTVRIWFKRMRVRAGLKKQITAHMLRHTCATLLLFNGCPIGHIKEILGHDRLETTCRYYLGVDKSAAKEAHRRYLSF